jgi:hypothetical protein
MRVFLSRKRVWIADSMAGGKGIPARGDAKMLFDQAGKVPFCELHIFKTLK